MKIGKTPGSVGGTGSAAGGSSTAGTGRAGGASGAPTSAAAGGASSASASQTNSAKVTLSPVAAQLQSALAASASSEVFDTKQVASIKQAISNGSFSVNPEKVADKLIQSVQEMLGARSGQGA